jgi:hypothetical protein
MAPVMIVSKLGLEEEPSSSDGNVLVAMAVSMPVMLPVTVYSEADLSDGRLLLWR